MHDKLVIDGVAEILRKASPIDFPEDLPIYAVPLVERLEEHFSQQRASAYTSIHLDMALRPFLEETGEWRGPGFATIIMTSGLDCELPDFYGLIIHEASHFLASCKQPSREVRKLADQCWPTANMQIWVNTHTKEDLNDDKPKWYRHEHRWIRAALHCWHRAGQNLWSGPRLSSCQIGGIFYGLSRASHYLEALGTELALFDDVPIKDLLDFSPPPKAFRELWEKDTGESIPAF